MGLCVLGIKKKEMCALEWVCVRQWRSNLYSFCCPVIIYCILRGIDPPWCSVMEIHAGSHTKADDTQWKCSILSMQYLSATFVDKSCVSAVFLGRHTHTLKERVQEIV